MERMRTILRRLCFSTYILENYLVVISGQIDVVRVVANEASVLAPRVRKSDVDGEELMQVHDEPGQFTDIAKRPIAQLHNMRAGTRVRVMGALKEAGFEVERGPDNVVRVEYLPCRKDEMEKLLGHAVLGTGVVMHTRPNPRKN